MQNIQVKIALLSALATLPTYGTEMSGAMDIVATSKHYDDQGNTVYGTGISVEPPAGYQGFIFPRSSISKTNLTLNNAVPLIDNDYRGEIILKFTNRSMENVAPHVRLNLVEGFIQLDGEYEVGDKIAQILFLPVPVINWNVSKVEDLSTTGRGSGGFGSTDKQMVIEFTEDSEATGDVQEEVLIEGSVSDDVNGAVKEFHDAVKLEGSAADEPTPEPTKTAASKRKSATTNPKK